MKSNRIRRFLCGLCLPIMATGVFAFGVEKENTEKDATKGADSAIRKFDLKTIAALGQQIFEQDGYASRATDIVFEKLGGPEELIKHKIGGWIVVKRGNSVVVRFSKRDGGSWTPAYDVIFDSPKKGVFKTAETKPCRNVNWLSSKPGRSRSKAFRNCIHAPYNTVILPDPAGRGFLVYVLAATTEADKIVVGGHYRFSISENGENFLRMILCSSRSWSSTSIAKAAEKNQQKPISYFVTNLVSGLPAGNARLSQPAPRNAVCRDHARRQHLGRRRQ